jgi:positive regulator of sigma E activity
MASEVDETLATEAAGRGRIAAASIAAGACTLAGGIVSTILNNSLPGGSDRVVTLIPALQRSLQGRANPQGVLAQQVLWIGDHVAFQVLSGLLIAIATLLTLLPLRYLFVATSARNAQQGRAAIIATVAGAVFAGVGYLVYTVAFSAEAASFRDAAVQTSGAARDAVSGPAVQASTLLYQLGRFALALGFVLVSLNAMRTGLLTRFFGILGIISGLLLVIPLDQPGIVRSFWLIAIGLMLLGRWMGGMPPAWRTGRAEPWPTQQEIRERREAMRRGEQVDADVGPAANGNGASAEPAPTPAGRPAHPSSRKRKRKRRG